MRRPLTTIFSLLLCLAPAIGAEDHRKSTTAIGELSSPYLEVRRRAVERLSRGGEEIERRLQESYPDSDYRTKELILECFRGGRPHAALDLVLLDIGTADGGVRAAQQRLVSAAYGRPRDLVQKLIRALGPLRNYPYEEALRCLPGPGRRAQAALERFVAGSPPDFLTRTRTLAELVEDMNRFRRGLRELARKGGNTAAAARSMERHLLRHDTERALLAVLESGGDQGSYEGLYEILADLRRGDDALDTLLGRLYRRHVKTSWLLGALGTERAVGARMALLLAATEGREPVPGVLARLRGAEPPDVRDVLLAILKWLPMPGDSGRTYEFVEPLEPGLDETKLRQMAAMALGDIGSWPDGEAITTYYRRGDLPGNRRSLPFELLRRNVAYACASLGDEGPLRGLVADWEDGGYTGDSNSVLAAAYSRLNEHETAYARYRSALRWDPADPLMNYNFACALSRGEETREALVALKQAVRAGYGKDPRALDWMDRDRDLDNLRKTPEYLVFRIGLGRRR